MNFSRQWDFIKTIVTEFFSQKSFFHGAALAYYAILALVPLLYLSVTFLDGLLDTIQWSILFARF